MSNLFWIIILILLSISFILWSIFAARQHFERNSCASYPQGYCFDDWQCPDEYQFMAGAYAKLSEFNNWISSKCVNQGPECCDTLCLNCAFKCGVNDGSNPCTDVNTAPDLATTCPVKTGGT